jgi:hypothetical protein
MSWKNISVVGGAKLFKVHSFTYMAKGTTYMLEIDEFSDGTFSGHGEHSQDKSSVIESVSGNAIEECLSSLIKKIESR